MSPRFIGSRGQSLVQVVIAMGVGTAAMLTFATMMNNQARETRALAEKMASLDLQRTLTSTMADPADCGRLFANANLVNGAGDLTYNQTNVSAANPHVIELRAVPGPAGSANIAVPNQAPSTLSSTLRVAANGIRFNVVSREKGNLQITFDQNNLVRSIHNLSLPVNLTTTLAGNVRTVTGCSTAPEDSLLQSTCKSLNGTFNPVTSKCAIPQPSGGGGCTDPAPSCGVGCPSGMGNLGAKTALCNNGTWICGCL